MVTPAQVTPRQQAIETRYAQIATREQDPAAVPASLFGPMEEWILELGTRQLLLFPTTGEWFIYDSLHESWERTGFRAGDATFFVHNRVLGVNLHHPPVLEQRPGDPGEPGERWYYRTAAVEAGPMTGTDLLRLDRLGRLPSDALVRRFGTLFWLKWSAVVRASSPSKPVAPGVPKSDPLPSAGEEIGLQTMVMRAPDLPPLRIIVESGPGVGMRLALPANGILGRIEGSAIQVDDPRVSRRHAEFRRAADGTWTLTDLGSANGTFVNGTPLKGMIALNPGDRIRVAETVLLVL